MKARTDWGMAGVLYGLLLATALVFAWAIWASSENSKEWEAYKVAHKCRIVARVAGDAYAVNTISANGQVGMGVAVSGDKTGWLCDDGITYYR